MYGLASRESLSKRQASWTRAVEETVKTLSSPLQQINFGSTGPSLTKEPLLTMLNSGLTFPPAMPTSENYETLKLMLDDLSVRFAKLEKEFHDEKHSVTEELKLLKAQLENPKISPKIVPPEDDDMIEEVEKSDILENMRKATVLAKDSRKSS